MGRDIDMRKHNSQPGTDTRGLLAILEASAKRMRRLVTALPEETHYKNQADESERLLELMRKELDPVGWHVLMYDWRRLGCNEAGEYRAMWVVKTKDDPRPQPLKTEAPEAAYKEHVGIMMTQFILVQDEKRADGRDDVHAIRQTLRHKLPAVEVSEGKGYVTIRVPRADAADLRALLQR